MNLTMLIHDIDVSILVGLNSHLAGTDLGLKIVHQFGNNPLIRGFPIFFSLIYVWFDSTSLERRSRCLLGLLGACIATAISVSTQEHWTPHVRPLLDSQLDLRLLGKVRAEDWGNRLGSFPSDTATLYFALCTIVLLERRAMGLVCFGWTAVTVGLARVTLGSHYPSDIVGGICLGTVTVYLVSSLGWLQRAIKNGLIGLGTEESISVSIYFLVLADAYNLFPGMQELYRVFKALLALLFR
jgi:undecaprenyl-diphosphatase